MCASYRNAFTGGTLRAVTGKQTDLDSTPAPPASQTRKVMVDVRVSYPELSPRQDAEAVHIIKEEVMQVFFELSYYGRIQKRYPEELT